MSRSLDYLDRMKNNTFVNHPPRPSWLATTVRSWPDLSIGQVSFDDTRETLRYLTGERAGFYYRAPRIRP